MRERERVREGEKRRGREILSTGNSRESHFRGNGHTEHTGYIYMLQYSGSTSYTCTLMVMHVSLHCTCTVHVLLSYCVQKSLKVIQLNLHLLNHHFLCGRTGGEAVCTQLYMYMYTCTCTCHILYVHVHTVCTCTYCMYVCTCTYCMYMYIQYVHVHVHTVCTRTYCMYMYIQYVHVHTVCRRDCFGSSDSLMCT